MQQVYLDNAATTPLHPEVMAAVNEAMIHFANPSSLHHLGAEAEKMVDRARAEVAGLMNVPPANLVFTSGGTEANNLAIKGVLANSKRRGRLLTSAIEHPSVLEVYRRLAAEGWEVVKIPVDEQGQVLVAALEEALAEPVLLVSIMAVNNETGVIQPLDTLVQIVKERQPQALVHVDGVQAFGKIGFTPARLGIDFATVSAHKIHGPKGIGALYLARRDLIRPLFDGGAQEGALRSGTENVLGIVGFGRAAVLARDEFEQRLYRVKELQAQLLKGLRELPCKVVSPAEAVPHIVAAAFPGFRGEILLQALSGHGVYVSTGAACSGKKGNLSYVAKEIGLDEETRIGLLRFSLSSVNTVAEIEYALAAINQVLADLAFVRGRRSR
jgi:cysteine desulfurase